MYNTELTDTLYKSKAKTEHQTKSVETLLTKKSTNVKKTGICLS